MAVGLSGLVLVFALWWTYFKVGARIDEHLSLRASFAWGYGHYAVFAAVAALGAGLGVATDAVLDHADLGPVAVAATVAIPIAIYLIAVTLLHAWPLSRTHALRIVAGCFALAVVDDRLGLDRRRGRSRGDGGRRTILLAINIVHSSTGRRPGADRRGRDGRVRPTAAAVR